MKPGQWIAQMAMALVLLGASSADAMHTKKAYQEAWCIKAGGQPSFKLQSNVTIDCLTDNHAIVIEFAYDWAEAIGLSKYFATLTGRQPGIVLIFENEARDFGYLSQLLTAIREDKNWVVWIIRPEDL